MHRLVAVTVVVLFGLAGLAPLVPADTTFRLIAQHPGTPAETIRPELEEIAEVETTYSVIDATLVSVSREDVDELRDHRDVTRLDPVVPVEPKLDIGRPSVQVDPPLWDATNRGGETTVAVIDSGVDDGHSGLSGRIDACVVLPDATRSPQRSPKCSDDSGHGTHVAGIVGGDGSGSSTFDGSDRKYAGMAPEVRFVVLDVSGDWSSANLLKALDWVHENHDEFDVSVVQNSWGRDRTGQRYDPGDPLVSASTTLVAEDDLAVVFAAGNDGPDERTLPMEAQNPNVLSVGAINDDTRTARFSSRGPVVQQDGSLAPWPKPDVVAPGSAIISAASSGDSPSRSYVEKSGTSMAAPHVGGIVALARAEHPELSAPQIHAIVRSSALDLDDPGADNTTGYGLVDAKTMFGVIQGANRTTRTERYVTSGQLAPGPDVFGPLFGRDFEGGTADGAIPVKPRAKALTLNVTWQGTTDATAELSVTLESPDGATHDVSANSSTRAQDTIREPARGEWTWRLALEEGGTTVDYTVNGTVAIETIDVPGLRGIEPAPGGGGLEGQIQRLILQLEPFVRKYPIPIAVGVVAVVGLGIAVARRD